MAYQHDSQVGHGKSEPNRNRGLELGRCAEGIAVTWRKAKAGNDGVSPRLAFGGLRELFSAITEKRLELIRFVTAHDGLNIRQAAQQLGRD